MKRLASLLFLFICLSVADSLCFAASFVVEADGSVEFGTAANPVTLSLNGKSITESIVPLGTIIDWWAPEGTETINIPKNYCVCDGSVINDSDSPYNGKNTPNLMGVFIQGATDPYKIGATGGQSSFSLTATTSTSGSHYHTVTQGTGLIPPSGPSLPVSGCYWMYNDDGNWCVTNWNGVAIGAAGCGQHTHSVNNTDSDGSHTHSVSATIPIVPQYCALLKLLKYK